MSFRVDFDCPAARQMRVLRVTGDAAIDNAANRCTQYLEHDSGIFQLPTAVDMTAALPTLQVNGRGHLRLFSGCGAAHD